MIRNLQNAARCIKCGRTREFLIEVIFYADLQSKEQAQNSPGGKVYRSFSQGPRARKMQSAMPPPSRSSSQITAAQNRPYSMAYQPSDGADSNDKDG